MERTGTPPIPSRCYREHEALQTNPNLAAPPPTLPQPPHCRPSTARSPHHGRACHPRHLALSRLLLRSLGATKFLCAKKRGQCKREENSVRPSRARPYCESPCCQPRATGWRAAVRRRGAEWVEEQQAHEAGSSGAKRSENRGEWSGGAGCGGEGAAGSPTHSGEADSTSWRGRGGCCVVSVAIAWRRISVDGDRRGWRDREERERESESGGTPLMSHSAHSHARIILPFLLSLFSSHSMSLFSGTRQVT